MRCPLCGRYGGRVIEKDRNNKHHCLMPDCCRETWNASCGHEWTQWTCEG